MGAIGVNKHHSATLAALEDLILFLVALPEGLGTEVDHILPELGS
jgi:hypothetical protein